MTTELHGCGQTEEGAVMAERCGCDGRLDVKLWPGQAPTPKKARVPKGGTAGQVLTKRSDADGDTEWTTPVEGDGRYVRLDPPGAYGHKAQEIQGILNIIDGAVNIIDQSGGIGSCVTVSGYYQNGSDAYINVSPVGIEMSSMTSEGEYAWIYLNVQLAKDSSQNPISQLLLSDGMYGNNVLLSGIKDPMNADDAANKKYVDDMVQAAVGDIAAVLDAINGEVA